MTDGVIEIILATARELADQDEFQIEGELGMETLLFGDGGMLDSMGLVSLVIAVEQAIEEHFDVGVALADEKALSQQNSPYRTVQSLASYATEQLDVARRDG